MTIQEVINTGIRSLASHKLRSGLSILGIVFGVAAVIAMLSIGEGARLEALKQIKLMGMNNITIRAMQLDKKMENDAKANLSMGLTLDDARKIEELSSFVDAIAPVKDYAVVARASDKETNARLVGVTDSYVRIAGLRVSNGRFIGRADSSDSKRVCVLGADQAAALFPSQDPLGKMVNIGDMSYLVVGVLESRNLPKEDNATVKIRDINNDIYAPLTTVTLSMDAAGAEGGISVSEIVIRIKDSVQIKAAEKVIRSILERLHDNAKDYEVIVPQELLRQTQKTQRMFNIVMGSIAGISLLVGGIGIMNIMLATVTERTREIGIRRALGANKTEILKQFLIEAVLLTVIGGVIGIFLGTVGAKIITYYARWTTAVSFTTIFISSGVSTVIGLIFGIYPAKKAAELNPIEALKYE